MNLLLPKLALFLSFVAHFLHFFSMKERSNKSVGGGRVPIFKIGNMGVASMGVVHLVVQVVQGEDLEDSEELAAQGDYTFKFLLFIDCMVACFPDLLSLLLGSFHFFLFSQLSFSGKMCCFFQKME